MNGYGNSIYRVTGDMRIAEGGSHTIEPGTIVEMAGNVDFSVWGMLVADGVTFTAIDAEHPRGRDLFLGQRRECQRAAWLRA
jgi:hypothetical protein